MAIRSIWLLKAFVAGFIATLVFHQGLFAIFHAAGMVPMAAYNMTPSAPLGVPEVLSLAFWGGVWGWPVAWLIRSDTGARYWLKSGALGAIGPTAVAMLLVFPLKGFPVDAKTVIGALLLNGIWGFGVGFLMRYLPPRNAKI